MGGVSFGQTTVTDELTFSSLGGKQGKSVTYADFSGKSLTSSAVYAGNYASTNTKDCIQIRSSKNSGIVTTTSGGTIKSIKIEFSEGSKTLDIYGKNTAYVSASDLYDSSKQGTKIGSAASNATITPTTSCNYIGIRSNNGAIYISKITVEWEIGSSDKTSTTLSFGTEYDGKTITKNVGDIYEALATLTPAVEGATITYKSSDDAVAEVDGGTVLTKKEGTTTITASYAGDDTYAASSASYTLNVVDGRTATTLTFPTSSYTFDLGSGDQEFTNVAVLNPAEAGTVTYKSSDENLAVVGDDGSVVVSTDKVGTATITASFAGTDIYKASEASYIITVKALQETFDFTGTEDYGSGLTPRSNYGSSEYDSATKWIAGNVTINTSKGTGNGARWWKTSSGNELRVYPNSDLTISVPNGYVITNLDLGVYNKMDVDCGTLNNSKWTGASQVVTVTPTETKKFKNITVTYAKLPTATLTTAASGFSTYAADYDVDYSAAGLKAYAITLDEAAKTVKYTEATGVVPAGKAVLVKGDANTEYTLTPATEEAGEFTTDLQISDGTVTTEGGLYYAFATVDGKSGFKKLADGLTIPAKKGYLKLSTASAKGFFDFDDTTTGIKGISEGTIDEEETPLFNLAGQRVSKSYKGVVVKNGKKFVNK